MIVEGKSRNRGIRKEIVTIGQQSRNGGRCSGGKYVGIEYPRGNTMGGKQVQAWISPE